MPELPDVTVFKQYLDATALHQRITNVADCHDRLLEGVSRKTLEKHLKNKTMTASRRYGKYLFVQLDDDEHLVMHFGMTGFLRYFKKEEKQPKHVRLLLELENGYYLAYVCQRKLGRFGLTESVENFVEGHNLGPDALDLCQDPDRFAEQAAGRRGALKGLLMNQKAIAGIGNIYADEILFQSDLSPKATAGDLSEKRLKQLAATVYHVLETAIEKGVGEKEWPDSWLLPHRKEGTRCPRCSGTIERLTVSGRAGYHCPKHQK